MEDEKFKEIFFFIGIDNRTRSDALLDLHILQSHSNDRTDPNFNGVCVCVCAYEANAR